jgi:hypothetical protein
VTRFPAASLLPWGAAAAALTLAACATARGADDPRALLERNRRLWASHRLVDYRYTVQVRCFCPGQVTRPVRVEVRGGRVARRAYADSASAPDSSFADTWPEVDGLFANVADALRRGAEEVRVEYDPRLGYPISIQIDYDRRVMDDETSIRASALEPIR